MKAAVFRELGKPLQIEEVPLPKVSAGQALVRVKAAEVARSIVERVKGKSVMGINLPIVPGSAGTGTVEEAGPGVESFKPGDRVGLYAILACQHCYNCLVGREDRCQNMKFMGYHFDGPFAQYIKVQASNLYPLPPSLGFEEGALLGSTFGTSYHALRTAQVRSGDIVAIYGLGALGLTGAQVAKLHGAFCIGVDVAEGKFKLAKELGVDETVSSQQEDFVQKVKGLCGSKGGADISYITVGNPSVMEQALEATRRGGKAIVIADCQELIRVKPFFLIMGLTLCGSTYFLKSELPEITELFEKKRVTLKPLINSVLPLEKVNEAISLLENKKNNLYRIVLAP